MTTYARGRCVSCTNDMYGYKCINKCSCNQFHRCDAVVGCILQTSIPTISTTYTGMTEPVLFSNERVTATETTVTMNGNLNDVTGTSKADWMIYTLCITSCFILTALCHLFRTYRNRHALSFEAVNEEVILKPLELTLYNDDIYDEVDENSLTFVTTGSNIPSQASQNETINFVFNERHSSTTDNGNDEVGYLDLYFTMKEDKNRQVEVRSSQTESLSTSSSNSDIVVQENMEYPKPYIPLQQYCQDDSHSCKVAVMVHQSIKRSPGIDDDATSNIYSNVCIPLQKDRQIKSQSNESRLSSDSKIVHETTLPFIIPSTFRTCYLQDCINMYAESEKTIDACGAIDSFEDKSIKKEKSKTF
ncbi:uncharacterized protein LOC127709497 [Mytilus californianus]|uniref:uncharacterized protein LOC127709497 n=1 Tax=Mytilus californianus TaxID=6549 RepID=UPI0022451239|nr:uncharacterized protein LOC127709497 [Mytilus californianus]